MRCSKCQKFYDAAARGVLSESLSRKVRDHLASCPACSVVWQENEALRYMIRKTAEPRAIPDQAYFVQLARQAIVQAQAESSGSSPARARSGLFEAMAGLLTGLRFGVAGWARAAAFLAIGIVAGLAVSSRTRATRTTIPERVAFPEIQSTAENLTPGSSLGGAGLASEKIVAASESGSEPKIFKIEDSARPPMDPALFVQAWQRTVALLDKMAPPDEVERLRQIQQVSRQAPVATLLTRLQDLKLQLARTGQLDYISDVRRAEQILGQLVAASPETQAGDLAHLDTYLKAAEAQFEKRYHDALRLYNLVTIQARGTYLAACATNKMGDINFEYFRNYNNAFIEYNSCLNEPLRRFLSDEVRNRIEERIGEITENSVDNYAPLDLFHRAEATSQSAVAIELHSALLKKYPQSPLAPKAIGAITRIARQSPDDTSLVAQALDTLDQFQDQNPSHPRLLEAQLAMADITNFCVRNRPQATLEYTKILEKAKDPEMVQTVQGRLRSLEKGR